MKGPDPAPSERGLTLVEMVVVLAILVLLAGVAVTATDGLVEQSRLEATRRSLSAIEEAVLGAPGARQPDGTLATAGFVADIGRLPAFVVDSVPGTGLQELWIRPAGVPDAGLEQPVAQDGTTVLDADVQILAGWRGPYLRLPLGAVSLLDGWTKPFALQRVDGTEAAAAGDPIGGVAGLGADGTAGGTAGYDVDLPIALHRTSAPVVPARHLGDLAGTVTVTVSAPVMVGTLVVVRVFGPVDGVVHDLATPAQFTITAASGTESFSYSFSDLPVGPRALRAYAAAAAPARDQVFGGTDPIARSRVRHVVLPEGGLSGVDLVIP